MLIFDFDGVLMDSVNEMAVSAYNAVTGNLIMSLEEMPGHSLELFRINRFHVQTAGDAAPLIGWCREHADASPDTMLGGEEYRSLIQQAEGTAAERAAYFFAIRKRFMEGDPDGWRNLNAPYQPLWDTLRDLGSDRVVILTHKNREATLNLCHHFGLMVRPENIYSGDHHVTKIENLRRIRNRFQTMDYIFLDDNIENLRELDAHFNTTQKALQLLLASWGYVGPDDATKATEAGYSWVGQEEIIDMLDMALPAGTG